MPPVATRDRTRARMRTHAISHFHPGSLLELNDRRQPAVCSKRIPLTAARSSSRVWRPSIPTTRWIHGFRLSTLQEGQTRRARTGRHGPRSRSPPCSRKAMALVPELQIVCPWRARVPSSGAIGQSGPAPGARRLRWAWVSPWATVTLGCRSPPERRHGARPASRSAALASLIEASARRTAGLQLVPRCR